MRRLFAPRYLLAALAFVAVGASLAVAGTRMTSSVDLNRATPLLGQLVPDEQVTTLDGETVSLRSLAGRAVIVNFWNTWCIPCQREVPALETFWSRHANDADLVFVGIVRDDTPEAVRSFVEERRWDWMIAFDEAERAALAFGTSGQPETFAVSLDGLVVGRRLGEATVEDLERLLAMARGDL